MLRSVHQLIKLNAFLREDECFVVDAYRFGNIGRYINDAKKPNAAFQPVFTPLDGQGCTCLHRMGIFALRDIKPFEEIVVNYGHGSLSR